MKAIDWTERGDLKSVDVYATLTDGDMLDLYTDKIRHQIEEEFKAQMPSNVTLNLIDHKTVDKAYKSKAEILALTAVLNFENPTCLSTNAVIEKKTLVDAENVPKKLVTDIKALFDNKVITTDEHHTDQLMIFMALANGKSRLACHDLSLHSQTMLELLKIYIPDIEISVEPIDDKKNDLITITGIGYDRS